MQVLEVPARADVDRATSSWAAALLTALVRDEVAGRRPARLTEAGRATWARFRGRLDATDLLALLFEDAAVLHQIPFSPAAVGGPLRLDRVPALDAEAWLRAIDTLDAHAPGPDYIAAQARLLGIPTRLARSDLHVVKPHQKVLELPGTGGQLAHHLISSQDDLSLRDNFAVACGSWQELTLAGLVALDLSAADTTFASRAGLTELRNSEHPLRQRSFDLVVGLHPDKGGLLRVDDQLAIWFHGAKILLV